MSLSGLFGIRRRLGKLVREILPARPLVPMHAFHECVLGAIDELSRLREGKLTGAYLEFGVSRGTSMAIMNKALSERGMDQVRCFGFDSFEGLPPESVDEGWVPGDFKSTEDATRAYLGKQGVDLSKIRLIKGWFSDTCNEQTLHECHIDQADIIMVDCDIYSASKVVFDFVAPLVRTNAIMICDDWGSGPKTGVPGQRDAFEEFMAKNPQFSSRSLPSYHEGSKVFLLTRDSQAG